MSDDLRKRIEIRLERLSEHLDIYRDVLATISEEYSPTGFELSSFAFMLENFYTEIEAIFKLCAKTLDGEIPDSDSWHRDLLTAMTEKTENHPGVISEELSVRLRDHLNFRHFSRHATAVVLDWEQMSPLVLTSEETFKRLKTELGEFLACLDNRREGQ